MQKHPGTVRSPWTGPGGRAPHGRSEPHATGVRLAFLPYCTLCIVLTERRALGGLKAGFVVDLDCLFCKVEVVEASYVMAMAAKRLEVEPFSC